MLFTKQLTAQCWLPWLQVVICLSNTELSHVWSLPVAVEVPASVTVLEGATAEFTCKVKGRLDGEDILWLVEYKEPSGYSNVFEKPAIVNALWDVSQLTQYKLGEFYTQYEHIEGDIYEYVLQIQNVTVYDGLLRFACAFRPIGSKTLTLFDTFVDLTVQTQPIRPPLCSYTPNNIPTVIPVEGFVITMTCTMLDDDPLPHLAWYSDGELITSDSTSNKMVNITLSSEDNGREFICRVSSLTLPNPLKCSVTPYHIHPIAKITPNVQRISNDMINAEFVCENIGTISETDPTSSTYFRWSWVPDMGIGVAEITYDRTSTLKITGEMANNTVVTCEIVIPTVSASNASTSVVIKEDDNSTLTNTDEETTPISCTVIVILSVIFTGVFSLILGFCVGLLVERKHAILRRCCCGDPQLSDPQLSGQNHQSPSRMEMGIYQPTGQAALSDLMSSLNSGSHEYDIINIPSSVLGNANVYAATGSKAAAETATGSKAAAETATGSKAAAAETRPYQDLKKGEVRKDQCDPEAYTPLKPSGPFRRQQQQQRYSDPAYLIV